MEQQGMTYSGTGVDYGAMDPFKCRAQFLARGTAGNIGRFGFSEVAWTRGESVYLIETPFGYLAQVEEGLGTKNLVADAVYMSTGISHYDQIAQDTVAMIVNDMCTLGALPLSVAMHLAVGDSGWFDDEERSSDIVRGWKYACDLARCVWGCGETPTLKDVIVPGTVVLAGSAIGIVTPKERLVKGDIRHGDAIVFVESSGIHANGLTMARRIAGRLEDGYSTELSDGRTFGETLLDPTHIYVPLVEDCLNCGVDIRYAVNITGHGWRKLMRLKKQFSYVVERLPAQLPVFDFIQEHGHVSDGEMYGNFNMGAGYALYVPEKDVDMTVSVARSLGLTAFRAGHIEASKEKKVIIEPKNLEYLGSTLGVR